MSHPTVAVPSVQAVEQYVGLDVGDRHTHACVLDEQGEVLEEVRLRTSRAEIEARFEDTARARVVIEAGAHSPWMVALLSRLGRVDPKLLAPIKPRSESCRADLAKIRARDELVRMRTALVNHVRGAVK